MACMPYKGALVAPSRPVPENPKKPDYTYEIDFVYGFKSEEARQHLYYSSK